MACSIGIPAGYLGRFPLYLRTDIPGVRTREVVLSTKGAVLLQPLESGRFFRILYGFEKNFREQNICWEQYKYTAVLQENKKKYPRCVHVGM